MSTSLSSKSIKAQKAEVSARFAVESITAQGDTIDAHKRLVRNVGARAIIWSQAGAIFFHSAMTGKVTPEFTQTLPAYSAIGFIAAAGGYTAYRRREAKDIQEAEYQQQKLRNYIGEPADLFTSITNDRPNVLRWYGLEQDEESQPAHRLFPAKLSLIAQKADDLDVDIITFGADEIVSYFEAEEWEPDRFGELLYAQKFMERHKHANIVDLEADEMLIEATTDQCRELAKELNIRLQGNFIKELMAKIDTLPRSSSLPMFYQEALDLGVDPLTYEPLIRCLKFEIERSASSEFSGRTRIKGPSGPETIRTSSIVQLKGRNLRTISAHRLQSGEYRAQLDGGISLLQLTGASTLEQLIEKITDDARYSAGAYDQQLNDIRIILYILARENQELLEQMHTRQNGQYVSGDMMPSLMQRMEDEGPDTIPYLRKHALGYTEDDASIEYKKRINDPSSFFRKVAAFALISFAFNGTVLNSAYHGMRGHYERQYESGGESAKRYGNVNSFIDGTASLPAKLFLDGYEAATSLHHVVQKTMSFMPKANWLSAADYRVDNPDNTFDPTGDKGNAYVDPGEFFATVGDVEGVSNKTVFDIQSLDGSSTDGYWYQKVFNDMSVVGTYTRQEATPPYDDATVVYNTSGRWNINSPEGYNNSFEERLPSLPSDDQPLAYKLNTSYLGTYDGIREYTPHDAADQTGKLISVPIKQGTKIVAARIVSNGQQVSEGKNSISLLLVGIKGAPANMINLPRKIFDLDNPVLEYWLAHDSESKITGLGTPTISNEVGYMSFKSESLPSVITKSDVVSIKTNLGLPTVATKFDIFNAVKLGKTYSFTPFKDSHAPFNRHIQNGFGTHRVIVEMAQALAKIDKANCNVAATETLLALRGEYQGNTLNYAVGYHDNGDGKLEMAESHAWLVNDRGQQVDATPYGFDQKPDKPDSEFVGITLKEGIVGTGLLIGLAGLGIAIKRRKKVAIGDDQESSENIQTHHRMLDTLNWLFYGAPESKPDSVGADMTKPLKARLSSAPGYGHEGTRKELSAKLNEAIKKRGIKVSASERRHLLRLMQAAQNSSK